MRGDRFRQKRGSPLGLGTTFPIEPQGPQHAIARISAQRQVATAFSNENLVTLS
jgi:hypothetical protein